MPTEPGQEACTVQDTVIDAPEDFPNVLCFVYPGSTVHGHVNWTVASKNGYASWLNFADDFDYNFRLIPADQDLPPQHDRGITTNNNRVTNGNNGSPYYIELEFASEEVSEQFRTPWWQGLAKLVDPIQLSEFRQYIHPKDGNRDPFVVTVGLFGLDCEHDCRSELHPVYALAIQLDEDPDDNVWALFARNWGNEGFCSSLNHELNLPEQKMSLLLPWPGAKDLKADLEQISPGTAVPAVDLLEDETGHRLGALVTFTLSKPSERGLAEAVLHLHWKGGSAMQPRAVTEAALASFSPQLGAEGEQDAEQRLRELRQAAGVTKLPTVSGAALPTGGAAPKPIKLNPGLYRLTKAQGLLGEQVKAPVECGGKGSANPCPKDAAKQQRDLDLWRRVCAGLKGKYPDDKVRQLCADPRL
jgi:hypothetical protein